jgi:DNA-directed RNA polymerase alpha subunit
MDFEVKGIDLSVVNALRRVILSEIPTIAIAFDPYNTENNDIRILKNNTSFHNEFLGHRISLIPVYAEPNHIESFEYTFKIHVKNNTNNLLDVTTDDIEVYNDINKPAIKKLTRSFFPVDPITGDPIIITKLKANTYNNKDGEELIVEFNARKGIAKQHARWCPTSTCTYMNLIDEDKAAREHTKLLKLNSNATPDELLKILNKFQTLDKQRYYQKNKYDEPSAFLFKLESECAFTPKYLLTTAFDILINKLESLTSIPNKLQIEVLHKEQKLYMAKVSDEDHTLGNMFQSLAYNMYVRESNTLDFIGYVQPHPLENFIIFKLKFKEDDMYPEKFFKTASVQMIKLLKKYQKLWNASTEM